MIDSILNASTADTALSLPRALLTLAVAIVLGAIISFTYMKTQPAFSQSFTLTMVIL